jgi:hypothetical protein
MNSRGGKDMLPDGFEQLELFRLSSNGELVPAIDFDNFDYSQNKEGEKWQDVINTIARKNKAER